jgi:TetR/AcrR family fatty acid metabolism transcriptional regulator
MRDAFAEWKTTLAAVDDPAERLRRFAIAAPRPAGPRSQAGRGVPGRAPAVHQVHGTAVVDAAPGLFGQIREAIVDGQRRGVFRGDIKPALAAKVFFGALDEMATNWILSRRKYALEADAERVVDLFLNGARERRMKDSSGRPRSSERERWARRLPRTSPTPGAGGLLDLTADVAARV